MGKQLTCRTPEYHKAFIESRVANVAKHTPQLPDVVLACIVIRNIGLNKRIACVEFTHALLRTACAMRA